MSTAAAVRPFEAHEWRIYRELRLRALADSPDSFARTFAEEEGRTDDEWAQLLARSTSSPSSFPVIAEQAMRPVGIAYGQIEAEDAELAHLFSMWVEPSARRSGVGRALVEAVASWARSKRARRLVLRVTESNALAVRLYEQTGFTATAEVVPLRLGSALQARTMLRVL